MVAYEDTEKAQHRSQTYSNASMSDRNVHGPHIHLSGQKSHKQIQEEMVSVSLFFLHLCKSDICANHNIFCIA